MLQKLIVESLYQKHRSEWSKQKEELRKRTKDKKDGKWTEAINDLI